MVIYKLGIYRGNNSKPFDLRNIISVESSKSLQNIDEFTSKFESENELKKYLLSKNIISDNESDQKIYILYRNDGYIKTLPVVYSTQKELLNIAIINIKMKNLSSNVKFLEKLLEHYDFYQFEKNPQSSNILNIKLCLNDIYRYGQQSTEYNKKLIESTIDSLIIIATRTLDKKTNNYKFNYRGFRDLAFLIYNFEEIEKLKELKNNIKQEIEDSDEERERMARLSGKWILSSEGDPDFPPNSEEEAMYLAYEEELLKSLENNISDPDCNNQKHRK